MLLCCGVLSTTVLWCINVLRCCSTLMYYQAPTPEGTRSPARWRSCGSRRGLSARHAPHTHVAAPCAARGLDRLPGGVLLGASIGVHLPRFPVIGHLSRHPHASRRRGVRAGRAGGSPLVTHLSHMWPPRARREGSIAARHERF